MKGDAQLMTKTWVGGVSSVWCFLVLQQFNWCLFYPFFAVSVYTTRHATPEGFKSSTSQDNYAQNQGLWALRRCCNQVQEVSHSM